MSNSSYVLVTGTSTGIGLATAKIIASNGYTVFAGVRKEADFKQLQHPNIIPIILDVAKSDSRDAALALIKEKVGKAGLHAVVNNAGFNYVAPYEYTNEEQLRAMFDVNVFGAAMLGAECIPLLMDSRKLTGKRVKIINISSIGGAVGLPWEWGYHATKFAVNGLSQATRIELAPLGIDVTAIMPGAIRTPFIDKSKDNKKNLVSMPNNDRSTYYQTNLDNFENLADDMFKSASAPEAVGNAVLKQINATKSKSKVRVGMDAKVFYFINRVLSAGMFEAFVSSLLIKKVK